MSIKFKLLFKPDIENELVSFSDNNTKIKYNHNEKKTPLYLILKNINYQIVDTDYDYYLYNKYGKLNINTICKNIPTDRKTIFLWITDNEKTIDNPNIIVYRTSIRKSRRLQNENVLPWCTPYKWNDLERQIDNNGFCPIITDKITIGFSGQVNLKSLGGQLREKCINELTKKVTKNTDINTSFIKRDSFIRDYDETNQESFRQYFIQNLKDNIFSLSVRGGGNWSLRFYEIMAHGRIPVLLNTDCMLPFDDIINWNDVIIIGENTDELYAKMKLWFSKGETFIKEKQLLNRTIWEKYLSIEGFSIHLNNFLYQTSI